ncbi:MAG: hypothetical protein JKY65_30195 [Planctomycetes bacterium]|nr:hypothetical protein [Planctomycetota bacterium]
MRTSSTSSLIEFLRRDPELDPERPEAALWAFMVDLKSRFDPEASVRAALAATTHVMVLYNLVNREDDRLHRVVEAAAQVVACRCEPCEDALRTACAVLGGHLGQVIENFAPPLPKRSLLPWRRLPPVPPGICLSVTLALTAINLTKVTLGREKGVLTLYCLDDVAKCACFALAAHRDPEAPEPEALPLTGARIPWDERITAADCEEIREVMRDAVLEWATA